jgi:hypothetical protein
MPPLPDPGKRRLIHATAEEEKRAHKHRQGVIAQLLTDAKDG